jgi:WS/DGAT/MGAT family acyltransferase
MDRLSPLDALFLHVEDGVCHMHIASCSVFEGPPPAFDDLLALVAGKLRRIPRYRQRVRFVPGQLGRPVWVDDPHFSIEYHVRHTALPAPGDAAALRRLMGRLMSQQLDRDRPLWETWMVEGLDDGGWAMISKVHHCLVDGVSGTDLMTVMLDDSPDTPAPEPDDWRPFPEPPMSHLVGTSLVSTIADPLALLRRVQSSIGSPQDLVNGTRALLTGTRSIGRRLDTNVPLSIEGTIGPHRRWASSTVPLSTVSAVRKAHGGTLNDVVLAAITGGFRELLLHRGDRLEPDTVLRTLVPVSVRALDDHSPNNQVAAIIAELPVGIADPLDRLHAMRRQMSALKGDHQSDASHALLEAAGVTPAPLVAAGLRAATAAMRYAPQRRVNTVTTNVPGPRHPLYACGRRMTHYLPFVPLTQGVRVGVAILTYDGAVSFGVTTDFDSVPEADLLADAISRSLDVLAAT